MSVLKIGVVGYVRELGEAGQKAQHLLNQAFDAIVAANPRVTEIWVVSGLSDLGVLGIAYRTAKNRGWKTEGVACGMVHGKPWFEGIDTYTIIGQEWGDESEAFLAACDVLVRIGGGDQSLREAALFKQRGGTTYQFELELTA